MELIDDNEALELSSAAQIIKMAGEGLGIRLQSAGFRVLGENSAH